MAYVSDRQYRSAMRDLRKQVEDLSDRLTRLEQEELPETSVTQADDVTPPKEKPSDIADIVGAPVATALEQAGYTTLKAIIAASDEELTAVKGVGVGSVKKLREAHQ